MSERDDIDPDAPITEEEAAASAKLRDALEAKPGERDAQIAEAVLARSLRAAWSPDPIDPEEHADLVADLPDADELARATALRDRLDGDPVVAALRAAYEPKAIDDAEHRAIVTRALEAAAAPGIVVDFAAARRMRRLRAVVAGTTATLALAASIVVWISQPKETPLAMTRSTQPLFADPFRAGEASARIDRIALARAADYRDNRFARWGAR
jgi:hypothetical protein